MLGLVVGLSAGTSSRAAVLGGVLTIAVADSMSDALGIPMAEESEGVHSGREVRGATLATFAAKLTAAVTFTIPVLILDLDQAVLVSIAWGAAAITLLSLHLAHDQDADPKRTAGEHLAVCASVVVTAHLVGRGVSAAFS